MLDQFLSPQARLSYRAHRQATRRAKKENLKKWRDTARPQQIAPPGDWSVWLILAGRGWGKTRTGAEWFREKAQTVPMLRIIAPTYADARDVCVEGESGLKAICEPGELVKWNRSMGEGEFKNGARFKVFSGEEPERLRGPQSYADWCDELAAWQYSQATWDMAMFGLRLGKNPQACVTTTPKPVQVVRELLKAPTTHITRGSTYDNRANLAPSFFTQIIAKYEGTRLGRQELNAELLEDTPGALWQRGQLELLRVDTAPPLQRTVVAIDPAATSHEGSDETGIVVAGRSADKQGYLLEDASGRYTPDQWARVAIDLYHKHRADRIVYETNQGGEMVEHTLRTVWRAAPLKGVQASKSKQARAEPISALYEQGKVHHVGAQFAQLEDQLCNWLPGDKSPDRLDAMVWAFTELLLEAGVQIFI